MKERFIASSGSRSNHVITSILTLLAVLLAGQAAYAKEGALNNFNAKYPESDSGTNASCQLCHGTNTSTWNEYGWGLRNNGSNFAALEDLSSVNDNGSTTMLYEINASTQPGWTTGNNNKLYLKDGTVSLITAPAGIGDLDPPNQPPVADAGGPYPGTAGLTLITFDGSGSSDPDGSIASYDWTFGDGSTGVGVKPTHTYAAPGTYTVSLTVTDDDSASDTATTTAEIVADFKDPVADPGGPYTGLVGIELAFDGSGSYDPDGGVITAYDWEFGDGNTGTGATPTHTYNADGTYTVTLTVVDDEGAQSAATTTVVINVPQDPVAEANGPYNGFKGIALTFDGSGSYDPDGGAIAEYNWDFGDGNTGTGLNPVHTYADADTYDVNLVVVDDEGAESAPATTTAVIEDNVPPVADPGGPYKGTAGDPVKFDGSASSDPDGSIVKYDWDFGDGNTAVGAESTTTHTYKASGKYDVKLTVTDEDGASTSGFTLVEVTTDSDNGGGCTIGNRGVFDPSLPLLVLVALLYLVRRRVCQGRICDQD